MRKNLGIVFRIFLMLCDVAAIILSFAGAYFVRTNLDQRPFYFQADIGQFILTICLMIPIWLIILAALELYQKSIFLDKPRSRETWRLLIASVIGVMALITLDFFLQIELFPVRIMALVALALCFIFLCLFRFLLRFVWKRVARQQIGTLRAVIVGNHDNTDHLASYIAGFPESGYQLVGVVAGNSHVSQPLRRFQYSSLQEALKQARPDVIFQTDEKNTEYIYRKSIEHHILYYFVPSEAALSSHIGQLELVGNTPAILVKVTPLSGGARLVKRLMDLVLGSIITLIALIPMLIIWLCIKISDPKAPAIYTSTRLSRFNQKVKIYKFRSMKPEYSGMSPEKAFAKMGKPELSKKYRENGDMLPDDPRVTKIGKFIRKTSLDEFPQFFNILKGDISLVGPRALVPGELRDYGDRSLLLSVKSGLTGLAQVSGRRDISFEERRSLDIYYVQNWSVGMDIRILFRTIGTVFKREGAK